MKVQPRTFTLEEANALLPELEEQLSQIYRKKEIHLRLHDVIFMHELLNHAEQCHGGGRVFFPKTFEEDIQGLETGFRDLERDIGEIHRRGCAIHDLENGVVDFPGEWKGRKVYFCWQKGEIEIRYYRDLQASWKERRLLESE